MMLRSAAVASRDDAAAGLLLYRDYLGRKARVMVRSGHVQLRLGEARPGRSASERTGGAGFSGTGHCWAIMIKAITGSARVSPVFVGSS